MVLFHVENQGVPGIVHGGAIASVMDEAMGGMAFLNHLPAVTAGLTLNYHRPLPVETTMYITTSIEKTEGKKVYIMGKMFDGNGMLFADSKGIFVKVPNERIGL
jgi:acyl-coenzyme A thioesterase PaaI-like protein